LLDGCSYIEAARKENYLLERSATMSVVLTDDLVRATHCTEAELRIEIAVMLYAKKKLSLGKAAEVAGLDRWDFQKALGEREVPINYTVEDLHQDLETLKRLKI
jgi:predicted HTH domain antitoxin